MISANPREDRWFRSAAAVMVLSMGLLFWLLAYYARSSACL